MIEFKRVSRWLWQSENYVITSLGDHPYGRWKVTRRAPNTETIGYARRREDAMVLAEADRRAQPGVRDLTNSHGRDIMEATTSETEGKHQMSDTQTFNTCQCYSIYTEREDGNRVWTSCGATIAQRKTFKPGHDAKYKSALLWAFRQGKEFVRVMADGVKIDDPMALAKERGWGHFMTPVKPKKAKKAKDEAVFAGDRGELDPETLEPATVEGFRPLRVKIGRAVKDAVLVSIDNDEQITIQYKKTKTATPTRIRVAKTQVVEGLENL